MNFPATFEGSMDVSAEKPTFLTLLLELRMKIYQEPLCPDPRSESVIEDETRGRRVFVKTSPLKSGKQTNRKLHAGEAIDGNGKDLKIEQPDYAAEGWQKIYYPHDIDPTIPHINKQIHDDVISTFYKNVIGMADLSSL